MANNCKIYSTRAVKAVMFTPQRLYSLLATSMRSITRFPLASLFCWNIKRTKALRMLGTEPTPAKVQI